MEFGFVAYIEHCILKPSLEICRSLTQFWSYKPVVILYNGYSCCAVGASEMLSWLHRNQLYRQQNIAHEQHSHLKLAIEEIR